MKRIFSAFMVTLILVSTFVLAFNIQSVKASGTIYIRADGSIDPPTANMTTADNVTYTFTDNNYEPIVVERNSTIIDGAGYTLQGPGQSGFSWYGINNVTIRDTNIRNFSCGIMVYNFSSCNTISGNTISDNGDGIWFPYSNKNNTVTGNNITSGINGIKLDQSSNNNIISGNNIANNEYGVYLSGSNNNTVLGNNITASYSGVRLNSVRDTTVSGNAIMNNDYGIYLYHSGNNTLTRNYIITNSQYGIWASWSDHNFISDNPVLNNRYGIGNYWYSPYNTIRGNEVRGNHERGIELDKSSNCIVCRNNVTANGGYGIVVGTSSNNSIVGNSVTNHVWYGVYVGFSSSDNSIVDNDIVSNSYTGLMLVGSSNNELVENNIRSNGHGITLIQFSNNSFYHNNILNNARQVYDFSWNDPTYPSSINNWDDGYPSGGNYWSDYNGMDFYSGSDQDVLGSDGIGDTPYVVDLNNTDRYPLLTPWKPPTDWWPMFHHDIEHSGYTTEKGPDTNSTLWVYPTGGYVYSSAAVVDDRVFIGSWDNYLYCINSSSGQLLWRYRARQMWIDSSPAVVDGIVYFGAWLEYQGTFFALNATTGSLIWYYDTNERNQFSSPAVSEGILYVGSGDGHLYAFNSTTGQVVWKRNMNGGRIGGSPAVAYGSVFIGNGLNLTSLNASSGDLLWSTVLGSWTVAGAASSPTVADGIVFFGKKIDNYVWGLNATTGQIIWSFGPTVNVEGAPAYFDGKLFVGYRDGPNYGGVMALNASTGTQLWDFFSCADVSSSPAVAGGKVFFGSHDGKVYSLNASNGNILWSYQTGDVIWLSSPAVAQDKLFIGSGDRKVYAFGLTHDISVKTATTSKSGCLPTPTAGKGYNVSIDVTLENQGDFPETFLVIACSDLSEIERRQVTLDPKENVVLSIVWETASFPMGNYSIEIVANTVLGETDVSDNIKACGWVFLTLAGDVDGNRRVDIFDIVRMAGGYGTKPPDPKYNPNCDIDGDGDIDIFDLVIAAGNYGESW